MRSGARTAWYIMAPCVGDTPLAKMYSDYEKDACLDPNVFGIVGTKSTSHSFELRATRRVRRQWRTAAVAAAFVAPTSGAMNTSRKADGTAATSTTTRVTPLAIPQLQPKGGGGGLTVSFQEGKGGGSQICASPYGCGHCLLLFKLRQYRFALMTGVSTDNYH